MVIIPGNRRAWDMIKTFPSVACVLHHVELDAAVLVRQFRPAVYASTVLSNTQGELPLTAGFTFELCAGLLDKTGKSMEETLQEEVRVHWAARLGRPRSSKS